MNEEESQLDWRAMTCEVHVYQRSFGDAVKGDPLRARSAYDNLGCRCESCALAQKLKGSEYRQANREKIAEQKKNYREANREQIRERDRNYREANREKIREGYRNYYQANREQIATKNAAYWKTEAGHATRRRDNLKRRSADQEFYESMTEEEWSRYFALSRFFHPDVETHVDHVMPVALGGSSHPDNLCVLTAAENLYKRDKHPLDCDLNLVPLAGKYRYDGN